MFKIKYLRKYYIKHQCEKCFFKYNETEKNFFDIYIYLCFSNNFNNE